MTFSIYRHEATSKSLKRHTLLIKVNSSCPNCLEQRWWSYPDPKAGQCGESAPPIDGKYLATCDPDDAQYK